MPLSLRDLWDSITSRPSRKHLKRQLAAERQRSARLAERLAAVERTKAALHAGLRDQRAKADEHVAERRRFVDLVVEADLVGEVFP
jgi:hypothetical protein